MDDPHPNVLTQTLAVEQTMSCRPRGTDSNDQGQHEDGNPRRGFSQFTEHQPDSSALLEVRFSWIIWPFY